MFDKIIAYSVRSKLMVGLFTLALVIWGLYSATQIPIDAVPDITNNQVQIYTVSPTLATQEVEQFITTPIELSLQNLQDITEIRSISKFGLSVITVVFEESHDIYLARQLITERLKEAQDAIPDGLGTPEMAPISTGLGEIYQYVVRPKEGFEDKYSATELRSIQDWLVKRQLSGIPGVAEVNSMGGFLKQYEVAVDPSLLRSLGIDVNDIFDALVKSNENTGGAYIEKNPNTYYIRTEGIATSLADIGNIVIKVEAGRPMLIKDVATVQFGKAPRYGALVRNGKEVVGGKVMMFKGANSSEVTELVKARVEQIQKSLPEGVMIEPYLVRDKLVSAAIGTVEKNLIEGGLIVILILVLMLGNWRAGLIVASVIPLAMLFALAMMNLLGISANLMSLGAIDFGLIVDGAIIIVESIVHRLNVKFAGKKLDAATMDREVIDSSQKIRTSAAFGEIIILMVYIPILALVGIEGKMFKPMAQTVMLAIAGALILSLTYVPMMTALFLNKEVSDKRTLADRIIAFFQRLYTPVLDYALRYKRIFVGLALLMFMVSFIGFSRMGGEFIPTLEEGDLAMQHILPPGSSLGQSVNTAAMIQNKLMADIPEIEDAVVNIGSAEIPTDPMPVEIGDYVLVMKPKDEWKTAKDRQGMFEVIESSLSSIPGVGLEFSQPIQLRFNELMTGSKADIAIKLYGQDLDMLYAKAKEAEVIISKIDGVGTCNVEQTVGMPQIIISYDYAKLAQYGLHIKEVNKVVRSAFAGEKAGVIYEGERRFDLVVRLDEKNRQGIDDVSGLFISLENGTQVPLENLAKIELINAPMQISRDNTNRRIVIGVNVGDTDVETLVESIQDKLDEGLALPAGYYFTYGGQFENLKAANARLAIAVPMALALIFLLLYFTFGSFTQAILICTAIPLSAIGGVWALYLRGLPFSISAGIGFIALFGVAVLNGIVLIGYFNQLKKEGMSDIAERIRIGTRVRLRPVIMTAAVASLGFLPMALSNSGGAEVQRPLATVVIGGLITATFLTLIILPILYSWTERWADRKRKTGILKVKGIATLLFVLFCSSAIQAQDEVITLDEAILLTLQNHPSAKAAELSVERMEQLSRIGYGLGNTEVYYQGDGLSEPNGQRVVQLGVKQEVPLPMAAWASKKLRRAELRSTEVDRDLTISELRMEVTLVYTDIQLAKKAMKVYRMNDSIYVENMRRAQLRVDLGEANGLELLSLRSRANEASLYIEKAEMELLALSSQLQLLMGRASPFSTEPMQTQQIPSALDSLQSPILRKAIVTREEEEARLKMDRAALSPKLSVGYAAQDYDDGGSLYGVQGGLSIPLFNGHLRKEIKSQRLAVDIADAKVLATRLDLESRRIGLLKNITITSRGVNMYKEQVDIFDPELLRIAQLNYEAGEIDYLQLLNAIDTRIRNFNSYREMTKAHVEALAAHDFLFNR
ncbi:MAG: CusA/CzcA family heavy metal efflux RND transporter [Flavobacteriales bacterium]|nr:CusA/CzcA family heavy metal efflux RND transporter [Flavobacteriales bacterium]